MGLAGQLALWMVIVAQSRPEELDSNLAFRRQATCEIAHLLELSYLAADQKHFDRCIKICDEILLVDPRYAVARELREDAQKARHKGDLSPAVARKVEEWKGLTDSDDPGKIPLASEFGFPSPEAWLAVAKRLGALRAQLGTDDSAAELAAIRSKLKTMKVDLSFENPTFEDIVAYLRDFTGLNIVLDARARGKIDLEKPITFRVKDLTIEHAMNLLVTHFGLEYIVTCEFVVLITLPECATTTLELHDLRTVLLKYAVPTGCEGIPYVPDGDGRPSTQLDPLVEPSEVPDAIVDLIRRNIAPNTWVGDRTIEKTPNQQLLVNHVPRVHGEIRKLLGMLLEFGPDARDAHRRRQLQGTIRKLVVGSRRARAELKSAGPLVVLALEDALAQGRDPDGTVKEVLGNHRAYWENQIASLLAKLEDDDIAIRCQAAAALTELATSARGFVEPLLHRRAAAASDQEVKARVRAILSARRPLRFPDAVEYWKERRGAGAAE